MDGGLENRCVGRVYGANGAVRRYDTHRKHFISCSKLFTDRSAEFVCVCV